MMGEMQKDVFESVTGEKLQTRLWLADGEPKAVVQLVHGMAEHIDRYDAPAKALNAAGYTVVGHTHLGHGEDAAVKGYFTDQNGWDALEDDVQTLRLKTQERFPTLPYFLLGHSMGSFVVRSYCLRYEKGLAGVIISGTGHFDPAILNVGSFVASVQCLFGMAKKPSNFLNNLNFKANNKQIDNPRTDFDWLSRNAENVDKYIADPLCGFTFTAGGYRDMFAGLKRLYPQNLSAMDKDVPVLLFSGDKDPVGACGEGVRKVSEEIIAAGVKDVTLKLYPDGRHEMFNELNSDEVLADLATWLGEKIKK